MFRQPSGDDATTGWMVSVYLSWLFLMPTNVAQTKNSV